jgi:hypothetical protein
MVNRFALHPFQPSFEVGKARGISEVINTLQQEFGTDVLAPVPWNLSPLVGDQPTI